MDEGEPARHGRQLGNSDEEGWVIKTSLAYYRMEEERVK
jgi:hypothetical protein